MSEVYNAQPDDVYVDGKLWRVIAICGEPTVTVVEIESAIPDSPIRMTGGISGCMWGGFKRIYTPEKKNES